MPGIRNSQTEEKKTYHRRVILSKVYLKKKKNNNLCPRQNKRSPQYKCFLENVRKDNIIYINKSILTLQQK